MPQGAQGGPGDDVYVEVELGIDGDHVMVQQQIPVVVRLYSGLLIRGGELSDPRADGAVLERLGNDRQYETTRNGREYQVIERRFSLSPERSGELRIAPVVFEGEVLANRGGSTRGATGNDRLDRLFANPMVESMFRDSPFTMFERGEPVRAQAKAITLQVDPRPTGFGGAHWLPAEAVAIDDSWATEPPRLRAGEPVTRTLTITAKGLAGTQIPEIEIPVPAGLRAYPEKTETESRTDGATLFGVSAQRVTLIPTAGGRLAMPEIRVTWWDTVAQTERVATVPAMTLDVEGAPASTPAPASASGTVDRSRRMQARPRLMAPMQRRPISQSSVSRTRPTGPSGPASARLVYCSALGWRCSGIAGASVQPLNCHWQRSRNRVWASCERRCIRPVRRTIRMPPRGPCSPGRRRFGRGNRRPTWRPSPPGSTAGAGASEQIQALERRLYAPDAGLSAGDAAAQWDGNALWLALKDGLGKANEQRRSGVDDLAPLYPHRPDHRDAGGPDSRPHPAL